MIKIEKTQVVGLEAAIRGMRNPLNSWARSDSVFDIYRNEDFGLYEGFTMAGDLKNSDSDFSDHDIHVDTVIGNADHDLMMRLAKNGSVHAKYRRMIIVYCDITAPLYWWKEFDTYKIGTVANSCSTMHKIQAKEFTLGDFSCEHLIMSDDNNLNSDFRAFDCGETESPEEAVLYDKWCALTDLDLDENKYPGDILNLTIRMLNRARDLYLQTKDKRYWWQMIQLLPSSYNQKRTIMLNYEVLAGIYPMRKDHKLDEWHEFCDWIKGLPYSELITLEFEEKEKPALDSIDDDIHVHLPKNSGRYPWGKSEDEKKEISFCCADQASLYLKMKGE